MLGLFCCYYALSMLWYLWKVTVASVWDLVVKRFKVKLIEMIRKGISCVNIRYIVIFRFGKNQVKSMSIHMSGKVNCLDEVK